ncbi:MAG: PEGA domain-containing protein [Myxococcota bacterium]
MRENASGYALDIKFEQIPSASVLAQLEEEVDLHRRHPARGTLGPVDVFSMGRTLRMLFPAFDPRASRLDFLMHALVSRGMPLGTHLSAWIVRKLAPIVERLEAAGRRPDVSEPGAVLVTERGQVALLGTGSPWIQALVTGSRASPHSPRATVRRLWFGLATGYRCPEAWPFAARDPEDGPLAAFLSQLPSTGTEAESVGLLTAVAHEYLGEDSPRGPEVLVRALIPLPPTPTPTLTDAGATASSPTAAPKQDPARQTHGLKTPDLPTPGLHAERTLTGASVPDTATPLSRPQNWEGWADVLGNDVDPENSNPRLEAAGSTMAEDGTGLTVPDIKPLAKRAETPASKRWFPPPPPGSSGAPTSTPRPQPEARRSVPTLPPRPSVPKPTAPNAPTKRSASRPTSIWAYLGAGALLLVAVASWLWVTAQTYDLGERPQPGLRSRSEPRPPSPAPAESPSQPKAGRAGELSPSEPKAPRAGELSPSEARPAGPSPDARPTSLLSVMSQPSGATVEFDGDFLGRTPLVLRRPLQDRSYRIRVTKAGYRPWTTRIEPDEENGNISLMVKLDAR